MKKVRIYIIVLLACLSQPVYAGNSIQLFPPTNIQSCGQDTALFFDGKSPVSCRPVVLTGAIMMFDLPACPSGWSELPGLAGRVIIGAGVYAETSPGSNPQEFSTIYNVGDQGGSVQRSLTLGQMPKHSHNIRFTGRPDDHDFTSLWTGDYLRKGYIEWDWTGFGAAAGPAPFEDPAQDKYGHSLLAADGDGLGPFTTNDWAGGTDKLSEGQAEPVDTRMPYYTLRFCRKN